MVSWQAWKKRLYTALFLGALSAQAAFAVPVVSVSSTPSPAVAGSQVALDVSIAGAADLFAYQFSMAFNPSVLRAISVAEGPFLSTGGSTYFDGGTIDNTAGTVTFLFDSLVGQVAGVNGGGLLARLTFNVVGAGTSALNFSDAIFLNSAGVDVGAQMQNGSLVAVAVPEPATLLLFAVGLAGLVALRRRQAN